MPKTVMYVCLNESCGIEFLGAKGPSLCPLCLHEYVSEIHFSNPEDTNGRIGDSAKVACDCSHKFDICYCDGTCMGSPS